MTTTVRDRLSGHEFEIRSKYLVGADGANSKVAADAGLPFGGKMGIGGSMNIVFKADLSKYVAYRPSVLYWVVQPGADVGGIGMGLVRMVRPWNEWLIVWGYDINEGAPKVDNAFATKVAHDLIGDDTIPIEIQSVSTWTVNNLYAERNTRGPGVLHGRRGTPASAVERPRLQHVDPGRLQPRLEAGDGPEGAGGAGAAGQATTPSARRWPSRSSPAPTSRSPNSDRSSRRWVCSTPGTPTRCRRTWTRGSRTRPRPKRSAPASATPSPSRNTSSTPMASK